MTDFLPTTYKQPPSKSNYLKFAEGDNRFRILSPAITGWEDWKEEDGKKIPVRSKEEPTQSIDPKKPVKHFWAFIIYDYREENVKILQITQRGIQDEILSLHQDKNWGSPLNYDLNIKREGKDFSNTKYSVMPTPPSPVSPEATQAFLSVKIDLTRLYLGEDPFGGETDKKPDFLKPDEPSEETIENTVDKINFNN